MTDDQPQPLKDGFRKRRLTPAQRRERIKQLIKSGEVADPAVGRQPPQDYSGREIHLFDVPIAEAAAAGTGE